MQRRDEETERDWQATLANSTPEEILVWAGREFGAENVTLACSFGGVSGMVLLELTRKLLPATSVFTLDTGFLFPETHALREAAATRYGFVPLVLTPAADATPGPRLPTTDACCAARKVAPTRRGLAGKSAWIAGLRRDQSRTREALQPVAWDDEFGLYKIAPLWSWTEEQCQDYIQSHDTPVNALHAQGFPSIGCWPCTRAIKPGEDLRAGRWEGEEKLECGLHLKTGGAS
jgi:phosphoadenosine phosphosulfate reductase